MTNPTTAQPAAEPPTPSNLATEISLYLENTTDHAEAIDRIIDAHSRVVCSYCGDATVEQMAVKDGVWTTEARELMQAHLLACPKRPERKLVELVDALTDALADIIGEELSGESNPNVRDDDAVHSFHVNFGMLRRGRAALAQVEELREL